MDRYGTLHLLLLYGGTYKQQISQHAVVARALDSSISNQIMDVERELENEIDFSDLIDF